MRRASSFHKAVIFVLVGMISLVLQTQGSMATTFTTVGKIEKISALYNALRIKMNAGVTQSEGCASANEFILDKSVVGADVEYFMLMSSAVLSAFHSGSDVHFLVIGCNGDYAQVWNVYVE